MTETKTAARKPRTSRTEGHASPGAVHQHGGLLPIYRCNTCGREVVWCESKRTGRHYLVNVSTGQVGQRYYVGADIHDCNGFMGRKGR